MTQNSGNPDFIGGPQNEREFLLWFAGALAVTDLTPSLAETAMTCCRHARGPRFGQALEIPRMLAGVVGDVGREHPWGEISDHLRRQIATRLDALSVSAVTQRIDHRLREVEERLEERLEGGGMERDLQELDRLLKMIQVRRLVRREERSARRQASPRTETYLELQELADNTRDALEEARAGTDQAYRERNILACVVARLVLDAGGAAGTFQDREGEEGFKTVVAFDLLGPDAGQCTFHMSDRDAGHIWMGGGELPHYPDEWDGHTTERKWARIAAFLKSELQPEAPAAGRWLRKALTDAGEAKPGELLEWLAADLNAALEVARRPELAEPTSGVDLDLLVELEGLLESARRKTLDGKAAIKSREP